MTDMPIPNKTSYAAKKQKVPPFARFKGTSAWRKYKSKAREYARFKASTAAHAA